MLDAACRFVEIQSRHQCKRLNTQPYVAHGVPTALVARNAFVRQRCAYDAGDKLCSPRCSQCCVTHGRTESLCSRCKL